MYRAQSLQPVQAINVEAPVTEVTVLEDRALVTRRFTVELAGEAELLVTEVSPLLVDKTLSLSFTEPGARALDCAIKREQRNGESELPGEQREGELGLMNAQSKVLLLRFKREQQAAQLARLRTLQALHWDEVAQDAARGVDADPKSVEELIGELRAAARELAQLESELAVAEAALEQARTLRAQAPAARESATLRLTVKAETGGKPRTFEGLLRYVVPNVAWRPRYRAELAGGCLSVEALATVWQNTGEAWSDVVLTFSSERPSLGGAPPPLSADVLYVQRRGALVVEAREESVDTLGPEGVERRVQSTQVPGIDDGGRPISLTSNGRVSVPSTGRPQHLELFSQAPECTVDLVVQPELSLFSSLRAKFRNSAPHPLLPGPVELLREGEIIGTTTIDFVAVQEPMTLGFGPDPNLQVQRELIPRPDKTALLSSWTTRIHDVRIKLSNLGASAIALTVEERVPVSEIEKLKFSVVAEETTEAKQPDANGFISWSVQLPSYGRTTLNLRVAEKRHSDVIG
jgi:uncharacterized protein (TIGR02231 family)